ncbi:MAG: rRNA pseudouridine synthase [Coriobacteriales bacterium]|nr:rRNA pseudouridine synthase [Coriobacteriales bacterium]
MQHEYEKIMRLQRYLARCGVASRRACEKMMLDGRVRVNGEVVTKLGSQVIAGLDDVMVDDIVVKLEDSYAYIILNKPAQTLTTMDDPFGRATVKELIPLDKYPGLFPVGRLDQDTTGILLFTSDGEIANMLLHPSHHVSKTYIAYLQDESNNEQLTKLEKGVVLDDGPTKKAKLRVLNLADVKKNQNEYGLYKLNFPKFKQIVSITITEGRKHQVKRMFEAIGNKVVHLHRKSFANIELENLQLGKWRNLTNDEVKTLISNALKVEE